MNRSGPPAYLEEALAVQRETVALFPDDVVSRNGLSETLRQLGRLEEALAVDRETIARFPHDVVARSGLAEALKLSGQLEEALVVYRETIALFPHEVVARTGFARTFTLLGRLEEALQFYDEIIRLFPGYSPAQSGRAEVLRLLGRFEEAAGELRHTAASHPSDVAASAMLADTYMRMGLHTEAITLYRALVRRFPSNPVVRNGLAEALRRCAAGEESGAAQGSRGVIKYRFQVALSFAGEDRAVAAEMANKLTERGVSVFYDDHEKASLWGKDLYQHLARVYSEEAQYCVVLVSEHYARKVWPRHELKQAQARAFRENREYLLPIRLDDTPIPGISHTVGYIDLRKDSTETVIQAILKKLASDATDETP